MFGHAWLRHVLKISFMLISGHGSRYGKRPCFLLNWVCCVKQQISSCGPVFITVHIIMPSIFGQPLLDTKLSGSRDKLKKKKEHSVHISVY